MAEKFATVEEYLASFAPDAQAVLQEVRRSIRAAIPDAEEQLSYGMVAERAGGRNVVYFGGWKRHAGMYPIYPLEPELEAEAAKYRSGKDSMHLAYDAPVPSALITRIAAALAARR